jgi:hypothetical protein
MTDGFLGQIPDVDPDETAEWITPYVNTIPRHEEPWFPGDEDRAPHPGVHPLERRGDGGARQQGADGIGGHLSTFASRRPRSTRWASTTSSAARTTATPATTIYIQGHASPGIYARAFLEGRLDEAHSTGSAARSPVDGWPAVVPAPAADARLLGVPDGVDGPGPDQLDLPGPLQPLPAQPRHRRHRPAAGVVLPRRRRDGRARDARRPSRWPAASSSTTSPGSSTATSSASTARCAATARSSRSSRPSSAAPAGTSSRSCGATKWDELLAADVDGASLTR